MDSQNSGNTPNKKADVTADAAANKIEDSIEKALDGAGAGKPTPLDNVRGEKYWMSLEQWGGDAKLAGRLENEFMASPYVAEANNGEPGFGRRDFLKVMGASVSLATTACVRRPAGHIIPYAKAPKEITPGEANFYTSTWFDGIEGAGSLVKTMEGRPIKMEGLPAHPMTLGGLNARAQAEVLALYDPDRLKGPVRNLLNKTRTNKESIATNFEEADGKILEALKKGGVAIISGSYPSPSMKAIISDFSNSYKAKWVQYDTLPVEAIRLGQKASYGRAVLPRYRFEKAKYVVSIDADFLGTFISPVEFSKKWAKQRTPGADMARHVAFESILSLTGMNADDRFRIRASQQLDVVLALISRVVKASKGTLHVPAGVAQAAKAYDESLASLGLNEKLFDKVAAELAAKRGESLVIAGGLPTLTERQLELQIAVNALNSLLGNDGKTIDHGGASFETLVGSPEEMKSLIAEMEAGKIKTLIIDGINLVYVMPGDSGLREALKNVETVIYTGNHNDETGFQAHWVLPAGSQLESWGDYELQKGVFSIQQPTIMPLYQTRSFGELLLSLTRAATNAPTRAKSASSWLEYVKSVWKSQIQSQVTLAKGKSFDDFWLDVLQVGVATTAYNRETVGSPRAFVGSISYKPAAAEGLELVLYPSIQIGDGRLGNVAWLQECPDPVSKVVWDNYLAVSPAMARKNGLKLGDVVELTVSGKKVKAPVLVQPGLHDDVMGLAVGYGQNHIGKVADGLGIDAYQFAGFNGGHPVFAGLKAEIKKTSGRYELVSTQDHHVMEGRNIVVEATNDAFQKDPSAGIQKNQVFTIWPQHQYTKHKWAMSIDLNTCTGCSACIIACQSENNTQTVGKRYVMEGREMHWIRIDRYYKGTPEDPESVFMPMLCQHCENAPCETVCPVLATVHNEEGLNDMVYNRCVGTRYCSNNCPYKVRRFNWFNYDKKREEPLHMAYNPDVTVRARGVMEKCTFCVHRIRHGTGKARDEKRPVRDGEIVPACAESCPSDAIVFGDLNDPNSRISSLFTAPRSYKALEELNTQPRIAYQSRIRNADRAAAPEAAKGKTAGGAPAHQQNNHQANQQVNQQQFNKEDQRV